MYIRRVSIIIPYNSKKEILLQHRTKDASYLPNYWGFFGGGIDDRETPEEAVIREIREELGIDLKELRFFKRYEIHEEKGVYERFIYLLPTFLTVEQLRAQQGEGSDLDFFSFEKTIALKFNTPNRVILKEVTDYLNKAA